MIFRVEGRAMNKINEYRDQLEGKGPFDTLKWSLDEFGVDNITLASSFSIEDQVLTQMLTGLESKARIFTLDTGRHFQETYDVMQRTIEKYRICYDVFAPDADAVADLISVDGPNLFFNSIEDRKRCCEIRKIIPLRKALSTVYAWVCGLRRDQSVTRDSLELIEWDETFGIYKINPLYNWSEEMVWDYIRGNDIPYNALYDKGYRSIGCAPCTRPVGDNDDIRAGRWWWESPEHKECGLHRKPC